MGWLCPQCPAPPAHRPQPSADAHLLPRPGHPEGLSALAHPRLEVRGQLPPHRDDGVALALLGQVSDATHEEPIGGDVGLASLDHAAAQLHQLRTGRRMGQHSRHQEARTQGQGPRQGSRNSAQGRVRQCPGHSCPRAAPGGKGRPLPACPPTLLSPPGTGGQLGMPQASAPGWEVGGKPRAGNPGPGGACGPGQGSAGPSQRGAQGCHPSFLPLALKPVPSSLPCLCPWPLTQALGGTAPWQLPPPPAKVPHPAWLGGRRPGRHRCACGMHTPVWV